MPVPVEYRTKTCKDIRIGLYDKNGLFISDITENARFHYVIGPNSREEDAMNLLISSDRKLLGRIKLGTTIKEYLSYHPMIFAEAHFIFDGVEKGGFSNGNYAAIEIELGDGTILKANSVLRE